MGELARDSICTLVEYITQDAALCSWSRRVYLTNLIQDDCCVFIARLAPSAIFVSYVAAFGGRSGGARRAGKEKERHQGALSSSRSKGAACHRPMSSKFDAVAQPRTITWIGEGELSSTVQRSKEPALKGRQSKLSAVGAWPILT